MPLSLTTGMYMLSGVLVLLRQPPPPSATRSSTLPAVSATGAAPRPCQLQRTIMLQSSTTGMYMLSEVLIVLPQPPPPSATPSSTLPAVSATGAAPRPWLLRAIATLLLLIVDWHTSLGDPT